MASSAVIEQAVEAINDAFGKFQPERLAPDVENFIGSLDQVAEAFSDALKKVASKLDDELPVHSDVTEALREMIPLLGSVAERAREANDTFKARHQTDLLRYHEPRTNEPAANV